MTEQYIIALDVGGSSVKSAVVSARDFGMSQFRTDELDSYANAEPIIDTIAGIITLQRQNASLQGLQGIAVGFPGPFDYVQGISLMKGGAATEAGVSHAGGKSKFESLYRINVREVLSARLELHDVPILFRNDAEAAIVGEAKYGAGRAFRRVIGITLGTGLGSTFIVNGKVVTNDSTVPPHGWLYSMPFGDVQADEVFSTRGLLRRLRAAGVTAADVKAAGDAVRGGDVHALTAFLDFGHALGQFLRPYTVAFRAQVVLVLGGIANTFDLFQPSLVSTLAVPVMTGTPGLHAALLGAADMFQKGA